MFIILLIYIHLRQGNALIGSYPFHDPPWLIRTNIAVIDFTAVIEISVEYI
jgi:hypothetical protein